MPNYDNVDIIAINNNDNNRNYQITIEDDVLRAKLNLVKSSSSILDDDHSNSASINSKNVISISSINELNNSTDSESIDSFDSDIFNNYNVKKINTEILNTTELEKVIGYNIPNSVDDLTSNININNLSLNQSTGVTIGNTNNINYIVNQYYPKNDNLGLVNNKNNVDENLKTASSKSITGNKYLSALNSKLCIWITSLSGFTLLIGISIYIIIRYENENNINYVDDIEKPGGKFFTRAEWGALPAKLIIPGTNLPMTKVVICHTGDVSAITEKECKELVRNTQKYHLDSQKPVFADIGYSFLVCGDGNIYEGRGWRKQTGIVDNDKRPETLAIGLTGNYEIFHPSSISINATKEFIRYAVEQKKLVPKYKLYSHDTFNPILKSPGQYLKEEIKNWRYFTTEIYN